MRRFFLIVICIILLLCMLLHAPLVIEGAHIGLELWYESVLPSVLPFMIITTLLLRQTSGRLTCGLGVFCGLPVGANLVNQQVCAGILSPFAGNVLLCVCNLTSPMFISGYILHQTLRQTVSPVRFLSVVYLPVLLYGTGAFLLHRLRLRRRGTQIQPGTNRQRGRTRQASAAPGLEPVIKHSLQVILLVGLYIMLFCILIQFLLTLLPASAPIRLLTASLEITNGIHLLAHSALPFHQKTALIAGLTSFGGVCSILQTQSVLTDQRLSVLHYIWIKLCLGGVSYLLGLLWF